LPVATVTHARAGDSSDTTQATLVRQHSSDTTQATLVRQHSPHERNVDAAAAAMQRAAAVQAARHVHHRRGVGLKAGAFPPPV
jgi:hypothetical protein